MSRTEYEQEVEKIQDLYDHGDIDADDYGQRLQKLDAKAFQQEDGE